MSRHRPAADSPSLRAVSSGIGRHRPGAATGIRCADIPAVRERMYVVPVGINYERKERFRSAVWIKVGRPIAVANWLAMHAGDERRSRPRPPATPTAAATHRVWRPSRQPCRPHPVLPRHLHF